MTKIPSDMLMNMNPAAVRRAYAEGRITEAQRREYAIGYVATFVNEPAPAEIVEWTEVGR